MPACFAIYGTTCYLTIACALLVGCGAEAQADATASKQEARSIDADELPTSTSSPVISLKATKASASISSATAASPSMIQPRATEKAVQRAAVPTRIPSAVAPAGERSPRTQTGTQNSAAITAVQRAREDLAQRLGIAADTIELLSVQQRFKPTGMSDSPGRAIGWDVRLAVDNQAYRYLVETNGQVHRR